MKKTVKTMRFAGQIGGVSDTGHLLDDNTTPWVIIGIDDELIVHNGIEQRSVTPNKFKLQGKTELPPVSPLPKNMLRPYARYAMHGGDVEWLHLWPDHIQQLREYAKEHKAELEPHEQMYGVGELVDFGLKRNEAEVYQGTIVAWNPRNGCYWVDCPEINYLLCVSESMIGF